MTEPYRVLARRWRPGRLSEVVGQEVAVRTLSRALATGRVPHAFLLTGIRGVGKTTIARILARGLCCDAGPTPEPCGACTHCLAIDGDAHPDVEEVDAASRGGIDNVRAIVEGVRYAPVVARHRVWIIDEAHMMSRDAFNALLKTLEQPPPEVVFVLATTEPEKIPATVASRCQRHSLRRVPDDLLIEHFSRICSAEGRMAEPDALSVLARASEGSVRDGLSMLDAAMGTEDGIITQTAVEAMLGLADRWRVEELLDVALVGRASDALTMWAELRALGAAPSMVCGDLLEGVLERTRVVVAEGGRVGKLAFAWQLLLKGCGEVQTAPRPDQALEMLLVRLCYAAEMPTPAEVISALTRKADA